ncbi:MAG: hypothetical protein QME81_11465 [bacterium]|nr:hypothetical protein [bacterium]
MMNKRNKDLNLLVLDMQGIENRLREFECKYRLRSSEFYRLAKEDKIEQRLDLIEWLGLYEILQTRETEYRQLLQQQVEPVLAALNKMPLPV